MQGGQREHQQSQENDLSPLWKTTKPVASLNKTQRQKVPQTGTSAAKVSRQLSPWRFRVKCVILLSIMVCLLVTE